MLIEIRNLKASFYGETLEDISLTMDEGETLGICGVKKSGLDLLVRILNGNFHNYQGSVKVLGKEVKEDRSYLSRTGTFVNGTTLYENISGRRHLKDQLTYKEHTENDVKEILSKFGLTDKILNKPGRKYTSYETQALELALAFIGKNDLIILDDPVLKLREDEKVLFNKFIKEEHEKGTSILMLSNFAKLLETFSTRMIYLEKGKILTEAEFKENRRIDYERGIAAIKGRNFAK